MNAEECKQQLVTIIDRLNPVLNKLGYVFEYSGSAISSRGPFAAGFYVNGKKKIGMIYRAGTGMGSVNYEYGNGEIAATHIDLMHYFGKQDVSKVEYGTSEFSVRAKDGGNITDALLYDIENFETEFLTSDDTQFRKILKDISRTSNADPDTKGMNWIIIGMVVGGIIGYFLQSLGWGVLLGFIVGLVGGIYFDLRPRKKNSGQ